MEPNGRRQDPQAGSSKPPRVDRRPRSLRAAGFVALVLGIAGVAGITGPFAGQAVAKPFLPLSVGDTWNYAASSRTAQVRIMDSFQYRDHLVYRVRGYLFGFSDADVLFLTDRNGNLLELNPELAGGADPGKTNLQVPLVSGVWYPWADLERPVDIPMFANDCIHGTRGAMQDGTPVSVPAGDFENALTIRYDTHPCADQDLVTEAFAPGIGLVARTVATFVGEERWALTSAIVSGQPIGVLNDTGRMHVVVAHDAPAEAARGAAVAAGGVAAGGVAERGADGAAGREASTWGAIKATFAR